MTDRAEEEFDPLANVSLPAAPEALNDDIADQITPNPAVLPVNGSVSSSIQSAGDQDYFRVSLQVGKAYVLSMEATGAGATLDAFLEWREPVNGTLFGTNDDGGIGRNALTVLRNITVSGDLFVVARGFDSSAGNVGNYTLTLTEIPAGRTASGDMPSNIGLPQPLPIYSWAEAMHHLTRSGDSWAQSFGAPVTITYAYRSTTGTGIPAEATGFQRFNADQIAASEVALRAWAEVANVTLVRVGSGAAGEPAYSDNAAILLGNYTQTGTPTVMGQTIKPTTGNQLASSAQGDVWINISAAQNVNPLTDTRGYSSLLQELGNALGLDDASESFNQNNRLWTVMSDLERPERLPGAAQVANQTPSIYDIAALQRLYGANIATRPGDDTYGFNNTTGNPVFGPDAVKRFTIWDAGGVDTIDASGYTERSIINLNEESLSTLNYPTILGPNIQPYQIGIARGVVIENAIGGAGGDEITGNSANNVLRGNGGNDILIGGGGADQMFGGTGDDTIVAAQGDAVLDGGDGTDTLSVGANADFRATTITGFERIGFTGVAGATVNIMLNAGQLSGFAANTVVSGSAAQDSVQIFQTTGTIDVSGWTFNFPAWGFDDYIVHVGNAAVTTTETYFGFPGLDIFFGGPGADIYDGNGAVDFAAYIFSLDGVTADLSIQGVAQTISAHQGQDTFIDLEGLAGSQLADTLRGDNGDNFLLGLHGNDTLIGRGGADDIRGGEHSDRIEGGMGADILWGGAPANTLSGPDGADTFVYRTAAEGGDSIQDFQAGIDKIEVSAAGFGLVAGATAALVANAKPDPAGAGAQFLYDTDDGFLYFDADGAGGADPVLLATLVTKPVLTAADIVITSIPPASLDGPVLEEMFKPDDAPAPEVSLDGVLGHDPGVF